MVDVFLAHAGGDAATALADDLTLRISALPEHDPEAPSVAVVRGDPVLSREADLVLILISRDADPDGPPDPALTQTIAVARGGRGLIIPIVADDLPDLRDVAHRLGLGDIRYRAIPDGGAGIDQLPFDGDRDAWLAATTAAVRLAVERALRSGQSPGGDLATTAAACREAARAVRDAAEAEQTALGSGLPKVLAAADSLERALAVDPIPLLATPLRLVDEAHDWAQGRAGAERTEAALAQAFMRVRRLEQAGAGAGRPPPRERQAPTRWVKLETPAGALDAANAETTLDLANILSAQRIAAPLLEELRTGSPGDDPVAGARVRAALRPVEDLHAIVDQALRPRSDSGSPMAGAEDADPGTAAPSPRRFRDVAWIDISELDATLVPQENALRKLEAAARTGVSAATRALIGEAALAVRRAITYSRRVTARAFGRYVPPLPTTPPTAPGSIWRSRIPGVDPAGWPVMVTLPRGRFQMGSPRSEEGHLKSERPRHAVTISHMVAFGIAPVTFAQWDAATAVNRALPHPLDRNWGRGGRPVINVSWEDTQAYLSRLNDRMGLTGRTDAYRLPTEAEWEYACRAGTTTPFSFGETITTEQANFDGNRGYGGAAASSVYRERTTPVGEFPPNPFGLYDMHGNVFEWCQDAWHDDYKGAPADGTECDGGDTSLRVVRGGSWVSGPQFLRSAIRYRGNPSGRFDLIGFRLARTLSPPTP